MEINGWWNIYRCNDCKTNFAISEETDVDGDIFCPHCLEWEGVTHENLDFIER